MIAIDTNLLIYAHRGGAPEHRAARQAIEQASESESGWGISASCLAEFWAVVTHPASIGGASKPSTAADFIRAMRGAGAELWVPAARYSERLLTMASELNIQGPRIFDLQIALTAFDNGARELWTHDRKFVSIPGLKVRDPISSS